MNRRFTELSALLQHASCLANIDRLRDGYIPSPEEKSAILEMSSKLSAYQSTAPRVLRERLQTQLAVNQSIISPLRRVPREIFSEIFVALADMEKYPDRVKAISTTVALVCKGWRAIAHATPQLWTYISLSGLPKWSGNPDCVKLLRLSGGLPLLIDLSDVENLAGAEDALYQIFLASPRWKVLSCHDVCAKIELHEPLDVPILEEVSATISQSATGRPLGFISGATTLRRLQLLLGQNDAEDIDWSGITLPAFPSLKKLTLVVACGILEDNPALHLALATLRDHRASLTELVLVMYGGLPPPQRSVAPTLIEMDALRDIYLGDALSCEVLKHIAAPGLEEVVLQGMTELPERSPFPFVHAFLSRQSLRIKRLSLDNLESPDYEELVSCLRLLSHLEEFRVRETDIQLKLLTPDLLRDLAVSEDRQALLPRLTTIRLGISHNKAMLSIKADLDTMLHSRDVPLICASQAVCKLETVEITSGKDVFDGDWW
ncbi:hypothetical protein GGG16DRAFT_94259 [Schizophyllum commune]